MADLPLDALPGETALGPDGRRYRLNYDDHWHIHTDERRPGDRPIPRAPADDPERRAAERKRDTAVRAALLAEEAAERAAAIAAAERHARSEEAKALLADQDSRPDADNMIAEIYEGDYAAVFAEVPPGHRRDGWTAERRILFLERLAEHGSVKSACAAVRCTRQSIYKLRPRAPAFAAAMDEAMRGSAALLADVLFDRALHGHQVPVLHEGEVVATRTVLHDALGLYLLRVRDPLNYAPIDELERWKKHRAIDAEARTALPHPRTEST